MIDEGSAVEESELSEQYCVHEWHSGELLQVYFHGEFVLLLLHHEGHLTETETLHFDHGSLSWLLNSTGERPRFSSLPVTPKSSTILPGRERTTARYTARAAEAKIVH